MTGLLLYTSADGQTRLDLRVEGQTVWLTQLEIAELLENAVVKESLTTASDGKQYRTNLYTHQDNQGLKAIKALEQSLKDNQP